MPFQKTVNLNNPLAVEGDFASANPRASVIAGEGGLVAGPLGVTVGQFAWVAADGKTVTNSGQGAVAPTGFVHRQEGAALITAFLGESSNLIPAGFPVTLHNAGDFFDKINPASATASTIGAAVYASFADGSAWIGSAPAGTTATGSIGATFTATATGNQLAVTAVTGFISIGDTISGTGVPAGTTILNQVSGTTGGAGTYTTSVVTTAAAATVTSFGNVLDVTAVVGTLAVGDPITGTGVPANATIASFVSGVLGGVGIYTLNVPATAYAASTALTVAGGILTKFVTKSVANVGELVKISTWGN
jgi:hypothetical protein